jgi:cytochrome c oxidase subunit I
MDELRQHEFKMPEPSYWPIVLAFGMMLMAVGIIFTLWVSLLGVLIALAAIVGWTLQNRREGSVHVGPAEEEETDE